MVKGTFTVKSEEGFHLRPAGILAKKSKEFESDSYLIYEDKKIKCSNMMQIVAACIKGGAEITIECEGPDEQKCLDAIISLAENDFAE